MELQPDPSKWQPITSAPHDGTEVWVRWQNAASRWMYPCKARYVANNLILTPFTEYFWATCVDENGRPIDLYPQPSEWQPIKTTSFAADILAFFKR